MTGLHGTRHVIVEGAVLVTDADLQPLDEGLAIVVHQPPAALAEMSDHVRTMHTSSGLLAAIEASTVSLTEAGEHALAYVQRHIAEPGAAPLCGNSIGVDRRF